MKIAIMGIRGIPANYGGFETFAEELALRLVERGHRVAVYGRSNIIDYEEQYYKGIRLVILSTIPRKYLDTLVHTFLSIIHSLFYRYDVILLCNSANSIFSFVPRLVGQKVVVNVDGMERRRKKWNWLGKVWYLLGEHFSTIFPSAIVSDARVIQDYYWDRYHKKSIFIPYGANTEKVDTTKVLEKFGVKPSEYILYVSRLEPENNAHIVIRAFERIKTNFKLVVVGDAPYSLEYIKKLKATADSRVVFTGFVFGESYKEFQCNAYCYIHATEVGGTHPALIEAMGFSNCVIANGTPENIEVVGDAGIIYKKNDVEDLREKIEYVIRNPQVIKMYGEKAKERIKANYSWDTVTDKYEDLFLKMIS